MKSVPVWDIWLANVELSASLHHFVNHGYNALRHAIVKEILHLDHCAVIKFKPIRWTID